MFNKKTQTEHFRLRFGFLAESVGFEPTWLAPNGFQDRLVMTASITLPVLYSLIYKRVKKEVGIDLSSRAVASQVFSAHTSLTTVFGMGTGGSSQLWTPTILFSLKIFVSSKLNNTQSNFDFKRPCLQVCLPLSF